MLNNLINYIIIFGYQCGEGTSNLKLQKLLYYVQAWHLASFETEIFSQDFEAWVHGPVIPDVYHQYKEFGWMPIRLSIDNIDDINIDKYLETLSPQSQQLVRDVVAEYLGETAHRLEELTHGEMPWQRARNELTPDAPSHEIIKKDWMIEYYSQFLKDDSKI